MRISKMVSRLSHTQLVSMEWRIEEKAQDANDMELN